MRNNSKAKVPIQFKIALPKWISYSIGILKEVGIAKASKNKVKETCQLETSERDHN